MNNEQKWDGQMKTTEEFQDGVEQVMAEKLTLGRADVALHGFAARLANATPPEDEAFRLALRKRLQVELGAESEMKKPWTALQTIIFPTRWERAVAIGFAACLILALGLLAGRFWTGGQPRLANIETGAAEVAGQLATKDIEALAAALDRNPAERTVLVYPPAYAPVLSQRLTETVVPLQVADTMQTAAIGKALESNLPADGLVELVLVNQDAGEASRPLRLALEQRIYRLDESEIFGALEWSPYVMGPKTSTLAPVGVLFEGGVELVAAGLLDELAAGAPLRMAFEWRITEPVDESLVMFAHLVHEGRPIAQRDAVPGNGLFPVSGWPLGEVVRDQKAMLLPLDLPAGEYELQVGIYSASSGRRYSLAGGDGDSYVVVRQFMVESADQAGQDL